MVQQVAKDTDAEQLMYLKHVRPVSCIRVLAVLRSTITAWKALFPARRVLTAAVHLVHDLSYCLGIGLAENCGQDKQYSRLRARRSWDQHEVPLTLLLLQVCYELSWQVGAFLLHNCANFATADRQKLKSTGTAAQAVD